MTFSNARPRNSAFLAALALTVLVLVVPPSASAAVTVERAELRSGELRVEGRGATPGATVTVSADSVAAARADAAGAFRVEASGYRSSTCHAIVADGSTSADVALAGCTVASTTPSTPPPSSTFRIIEETLPGGNVGTSYSASLTSRGAEGDKPVEYRVVAGQLPLGLTLTRSFGVASALITGTPSRTESATFTVEAQDEAGHRVQRTYTIVIGPPLPLAITNPSDQLAPATVGTSYQMQLFANGGVRPYSWSLAGGQLPPGLRLGTGGLIAGTPTTTGVFSFTASVRDQAGVQASRTFSIAVTR